MPDDERSHGLVLGKEIDQVGHVYCKVRSDIEVQEICGAPALKTKRTLKGLAPGLLFSDGTGGRRPACRKGSSHC